MILHIDFRFRVSSSLRQQVNRVFSLSRQVLEQRREDENLRQEMLQPCEPRLLPDREVAPLSPERNDLTELVSAKETGKKLVSFVCMQPLRVTTSECVIRKISC